MSESEIKRIRKNNETSEKIYRLQNEKLFSVDETKSVERPRYPWEDRTMSGLLKITKEYFRCKGSSGNPERTVGGKHFRDCEGIDTHGLPFRDGKEFVYPILIELLNYLQEKTKEKAIITSGYRCPIHNSYVSAPEKNATSKHQVGAEVNFYVQNFENTPQEIVKILMQYYQDEKNSSFNPFHRCISNPKGLKHSGWYNKEVIIRIHEKDESRDFDNRHPYPFISIEVRYDRDTNSVVSYDWNEAYKGYLRN